MRLDVNGWRGGDYHMSFTVKNAAGEGRDITLKSFKLW